MLAGLITALAAVVSDQASKALVFGFLAETQPVVAVTPFFNLVSAWKMCIRDRCSGGGKGANPKRLCRRHGAGDNGRFGRFRTRINKIRKGF